VSTGSGKPGKSGKVRELKIGLGKSGNSACGQGKFTETLKDVAPYNYMDGKTTRKQFSSSEIKPRANRFPGKSQGKW